MSVNNSRVADWIELSTTTGTTNANALTAASAKVATTTEPVTVEASGLYVFETVGRDSSGVVNEAIHYGIMPLLQDANNETCGIRVWGYRRVPATSANTGTTLYVPHMLLDLDVTAGALTGVNATAIENEWFFADTITIADDNTRGASGEVHASGTDGIAFVTFDAMGFSHIEIEASVEASAAAIRVLYTAL